MIDFVKRLYVFSQDGFQVGYYVVSSEHLKFCLIHEAVQMKIVITICFHFSEMTKYHFRLLIKDEVVYEKAAETEGQIAIVSGDIQARVSEYVMERELKGAENGEGKEGVNEGAGDIASS